MSHCLGYYKTVMTVICVSLLSNLHSLPQASSDVNVSDLMRVKADKKATKQNQICPELTLSAVLHRFPPRRHYTDTKQFCIILLTL